MENSASLLVLSASTSKQRLPHEPPKHCTKQKPPPLSGHRILQVDGRAEPRLHLIYHGPVLESPRGYAVKRENTELTKG